MASEQNMRIKVSHGWLTVTAPAVMTRDDVQRAYGAVRSLQSEAPRSPEQTFKLLGDVFVEAAPTTPLPFTKVTLAQHVAEVADEYAIPREATAAFTQQVLGVPVSSEVP